jgi:hypothetical protein
MLNGNNARAFSDKMWVELNLPCLKDIFTYLPRHRWEDN